MGSHTDKERKICDDRVVIYQRTDVKKASWHCKISFPKHPPIRQSLWTVNEKDAVRLATALYNKLQYRYDRGLPIKQVKFEEAMASYFANLEDEVKRGITKPERLATNRIMSRYCLEFFKGKFINTISTNEIIRFQNWRRRYWTTGPGSKITEHTYQRQGKTVVSKARPPKEPAVSTQNSENVLLRGIFNHAALNDWIAKAEIPVIEIKVSHAEKSKDAKRRPGIDSDDYQYLLQVSKERLDEVANNDRLLHQRFMLHTFIGIMGHSGMRPFEAMGLRIKDLESFMQKDTDYVKVYVSGKNKWRRLVPLHGYYKYFDTLIGYISEFRDKHPEIYPNNIGGVENNGDPLFFDYDGSKLKSMAKGFSNLLKDADLYIDKETGKRRDAYCLRHYYATERLLAGVPHLILADNMGTTVAMIERHYSHIRPELSASILTQENKD